MVVALRNFLVVLLLTAAFTSNAQNYYEPKLSFSTDLGIPARGQNGAFQRVLEGLFNGGLTMQYNVFGGITAGLGVKYSFFTISPFALNNVPWSGGFHMPSAYFKVGYERFTTDRVSFNVSARMGYSVLFATHGNDSVPAGLERNPVETCFFIEPQVEVVLLTEKSSSDGFSLILGYPFYFNEFGPRYLGMEQFPNLIDEDYVGITRFFSFGFGYRYYFGRK